MLTLAAGKRNTFVLNSPRPVLRLLNSLPVQTTGSVNPAPVTQLDAERDRLPHPRGLSFIGVPPATDPPPLPLGTRTGEVLGDSVRNDESDRLRIPPQPQPQPPVETLLVVLVRHDLFSFVLVVPRLLTFGTTTRMEPAASLTLDIETTPAVLLHALARELGSQCPRNLDRRVVFHQDSLFLDPDCQCLVEDLCLPVDLDLLARLHLVRQPELLFRPRRLTIEPFVRATRPAQPDHVLAALTARTDVHAISHASMEYRVAAR